MEQTPISTTNENVFDIKETEPLKARLQHKYEELNETYRGYCDKLSDIRLQIGKAQQNLNELPQLANRLKEVMRDHTAQIDAVNRQIDVERSAIEVYNRQQQEQNGLVDIRKGLLSEVCTTNEQNIVEDGCDVKISELKRRIHLREERIAELNKQKNALLEKAKTIQSKLTNDSLQQLKQEGLNRIQTLKMTESELAAACIKAQQKCRVCSRLLEDLHERDLLLNYAKNNGLILTTGT